MVEAGLSFRICEKRLKMSKRQTEGKVEGSRVRKLLRHTYAVT